MSTIPTTYKINGPGVVHETIDGEVVVVNLEKGNYYSLLKVAADVWNKIEKGISKQEIIAELSQQYNNIDEEIQKSVDKFLEELHREQLITLDTNNVAESTNDFYTTIKTQTIQEKLEFEPPILDRFTDMKDLLLLDPIHEVEEACWPNAKQ